MFSRAYTHLNQHSSRQFSRPYIHKKIRTGRSVDIVANDQRLTSFKAYSYLLKNISHCCDSPYSSYKEPTSLGPKVSNCAIFE